MSRRLAVLAFVLPLLACERVEPPQPAPPAEFIVAAGDSVFWIRSERDGIRVRGGPMVLAMVGGRVAEVYVTDDDHSFYDAVYVGQRLYKRDLIDGDSVQLVSDTLMRLLARAYATANPDERPLTPNELGSENPRTIASAELRVLDVMGPWLSYEYRTDVDIVGRPSSHGLRRGVVDLRTGVPSTLESLFGRVASREIADEGRRQWRDWRDSVLVASEQQESVRAEFDRLAFDPRSFALVVHDRAPRVRFTLAQSGAPTASSAHHLFPIRVEEPVWWEGVREAYPEEGELGERQWVRDAYSIIARGVAGPPSRVAFALRDEGGQEWRLGSVPSPVLRVMWLDDTLIAPGTREALVRAFDEAALYSPETRVVERRRPLQAARVLPASSVARAPGTPRRHAPLRARVTR